MTKHQNEDWVVVERPMVIDRQRPEYCGAISEDIDRCPVCPATVSGRDVVHGVCQALKSGPPPKPLVELVVTHK